MSSPNWIFDLFLHSRIYSRFPLSIFIESILFLSAASQFEMLALLLPIEKQWQARVIAHIFSTCSSTFLVCRLLNATAATRNIRTLPNSHFPLLFLRNGDKNVCCNKVLGKLHPPPSDVNDYVLHAGSFSEHFWISSCFYNPSFFKYFPNMIKSL